jgi:sarcosine oxidase
MPRAAAYDTIVVGLGAMGSATLYHLAERGQRVLGLEQFTQNHRMGSSHGDSRIIREQYFEHPLYVPLVQRAHSLWRELERRSGVPLMRINGGLMIGPPDGSVVTGTIRSATEHGLAHEVLSPDEVRRRFPAFAMGPDLVAVFDPHAGFLDPDACNRAHAQGARLAGAEVRYDEVALEWQADGDGVSVRTPAGSYRTDNLVLTLGSWTPDLAGDLALPLSVERQVLFWFDVDRSDTRYDTANFPIFAYEFTPGSICYGLPRLLRGAKAAVMHHGEIAPHPWEVRRSVDASEVEALRAALEPVLPDLSRAPVKESGVCLFTNTPDHDFLIDRHPVHPQVLLSTPCSGHGFKFASAIGEAQAQIVMDGESKLDLSAFSIARFGRRTP